MSSDALCMGGIEASLGLGGRYGGGPFLLLVIRGLGVLRVGRWPRRRSLSVLSMGSVMVGIGVSLDSIRSMELFSICRGTLVGVIAMSNSLAKVRGLISSWVVTLFEARGVVVFSLVSTSSDSMRALDLTRVTTFFVASWALALLVVSRASSTSLVPFALGVVGFVFTCVF